MARVCDWQPDIFEINIGDMMLSVVDSNEVLEDSRNEMHFHSVFEFLYIPDETLKIRTDGKTHTVCGGEYVIIPPNCFHSTIKPQTGRQAFLFSLNFLPKVKAEESEYRYYNSIFSGLNSVFIHRNNTVTDCMKRITETNGSGISVHKMKILFGMLLLAVSEDIAGNKDVSCDVNIFDVNETLYKQKLRGVVGDYISRFCCESDILSSVAEILHMSERNTARIIKSIFGVPVSTLVLNQRMVYAKELILNSELQLCEIAEKVGYRQYVTFYKAFKKHYGVSPEKMRK